MDWRYAAIIGGAVLLQLGVFICWVSFLGIARVGASRLQIAIAFPDFYHSGVAALALGGMTFFSLYALGLARWIRAARFTLSDLILLVMILSLLVAWAMSGVLNQSGYLSILLCPVYSGLMNPLNTNYFGYENFNVVLNGVAFAFVLVFLTGLWGRVSLRWRRVKYAVCLLLLSGWMFSGTANGIHIVCLVTMLTVMFCSFIDLAAVRRISAPSARILPPAR